MNIHDVLLRLVICEPTTLDTGCWEWPGERTSKGYGRAPMNGKRRRVHRVVYEHFVGPIPAGADLHHRCHNTVCANFEHVEPLQPRDHTLRGSTPPALNALKTHCKRGHPLSGDNLRIGPRGERRCFTCNAENVKEWQRRNPRSGRSAAAFQAQVDALALSLHEALDLIEAFNTTLTQTSHPAVADLIASSYAFLKRHGRT